MKPRALELIRYAPTFARLTAHTVLLPKHRVICYKGESGLYRRPLEICCDTSPLLRWHHLEPSSFFSGGNNDCRSSENLWGDS
jgi:hypothetical protein